MANYAVRVGSMIIRILITSLETSQCTGHCFTDTLYMYVGLLTAQRRYMYHLPDRYACSVQMDQYCVQHRYIFLNYP